MFIDLNVSDCKFMLYPPSMIAAGCIGAAARGLCSLEGQLDSKLLLRLHTITNIDVVSCNFKYIVKLFTGYILFEVSMGIRICWAICLGAFAIYNFILMNSNTCRVFLCKIKNTDWNRILLAVSYCSSQKV